MCGFARPVIRQVSGGSCLVVAWIAATLAGTLYLVGPEHLGGLGDLAAKIDAAVKESGKTPMEVADSVCIIAFMCFITESIFQVLKSYDGKLVQIPGLPPMYDHDFFPQEVSGCCRFCRRP